MAKTKTKDKQELKLIPSEAEILEKVFVLLDLNQKEIDLNKDIIRTYKSIENDVREFAIKNKSFAKSRWIINEYGQLGTQVTDKALRRILKEMKDTKLGEVRVEINESGFLTITDFDELNHAYEILEILRYIQDTFGGTFTADKVFSKRLKQHTDRCLVHAKQYEKVCKMVGIKI